MIRYFGDAHLNLYVDNTFFVYSEDKLAEQIRNPAIKAFSSHFVRTFPPQLAERDMLYVAFLRDPIQQFVSHLTYTRKHFERITEPELRSCLPPDMPSISLRESARWILTSPREEVKFRENHNTNFIARYPFRQRAGGSYSESRYRKTRLALAESILEKFFFVGITEQMDLSIELLRKRAKQFGIDFPPGNVLKENVSGEIRDDLSWTDPKDEVGALLWNATREDQRLYEWAQARLARLQRQEQMRTQVDANLRMAQHS